MSAKKKKDSDLIVAPAFNAVSLVSLYTRKPPQIRELRSNRAYSTEQHRGPTTTAVPVQYMYLRLLSIEMFAVMSEFAVASRL